ncbi:MAG: hypothetical protein GY795_46610 [Desulfobacterales bacterium]|nr:hypothetical protein [Desulfobacterales bacterium]
MKFILIISSIFFVCCSNNKQNHNDTPELNGKWLTISFSEEALKRHNSKFDEPLEKHIMVFLQDGEWRRYSPEKGWSKMLLEYKLENNEFFARPFKKTEFKKIGTYKEPDILIFELRKNHKITYKRIDNSINIHDLDLSGMPKIE